LGVRAGGPRRGVRAPAFTKAFKHSPAFEEQRPLAESCSADRRRNVDGRCFVDYEPWAAMPFSKESTDESGS
jgi:hypothetical protein